MNWITKIRNKIIGWFIEDPADTPLTSKELKQLVALVNIDLKNTKYNEEDLAVMTLLLAKLKNAEHN